ncbi:MAG: hypothetical protein H8F28_13945 [Fibrella sp.]|nr:hypothetical protein [Armatimonadota bacterium]
MRNAPAVGSAILGGGAGAVVGIVAAFLCASALSGNNTLAAGFILVFAAPLGLLLGTGAGIWGGLAALRFFQSGTPQEPERRKGAVAWAIALGVPALIAAMGWGIFLLEQPPSDRKLLANFRRHKSTFDDLTRMVRTDKGLTRVDENWTAPSEPEKINVSGVRIREYRRLLTSGNAKRGFSADERGTAIRFHCWVAGSAISSTVLKGYFYSETPPKPLFQNLDDCGRWGCSADKWDAGYKGEAYRPIGGNWYLFYKRVSG